MLPVRPEPLAAFSALAMTQSMLLVRDQRRQRLFRNVTPGGPTMSPRKRMRMRIPTV